MADPAHGDCAIGHKPADTREIPADRPRRAASQPCTMALQVVVEKAPNRNMMW